MIKITAIHNGTKHLIEADHVISTMSLGILKTNHESLFTPKLPPPIVEAINEISFGATDHIKLDFEEPFWDLDNPGIMILWSSDIDSTIGVKVRNMKMDLNIYVTWRRVGQ